MNKSRRVEPKKLEAADWGQANKISRVQAPLMLLIQIVDVVGARTETP